VTGGKKHISTGGHRAFPECQPIEMNNESKATLLRQKPGIKLSQVYHAKHLICQQLKIEIAALKGNS
jgi:hypothetical protein